MHLLQLNGELGGVSFLLRYGREAGMISFIGDVHGKIKQYEEICSKLRSENSGTWTIQVGDVGLGFSGVKMPSLTEKDFFIHGNHDDALICEKSPNFLGSFGVKQMNDHKVFFLSGAESIDKQYRTEGKTWWAYEELTYEELCQAVELYRKEKPNIVVTHDCPLATRKQMFGLTESGRTIQALEAMLCDHQPKEWVFGHHHLNRQDTICGVKFTCVAELSVYQIH